MKFTPEQREQIRKWVEEDRICDRMRSEIQSTHEERRKMMNDNAAEIRKINAKLRVKLNRSGKKLCHQMLVLGKRQGDLNERFKRRFLELYNQEQARMARVNRGKL